jgi:hypothetical protein
MMKRGRKGDNVKKTKTKTTTDITTTTLDATHIVTPADGTVGAILNTVTKEDVIAILVQERADDLAKKKQAGEAALHKLDAEIQATQARWPKVQATHKRTVDTELDSEAIRALTDAGYGKFALEVDDGDRDDEKQHFVFRVSIKAPERSYSAGSHRTVTVPFDQKAREILIETSRLRREIATAQQHLLSIKREIADIPIMERRARAKLAAVSLSRDKDGAALLAELRKVKELSA